MMYQYDTGLVADAPALRDIASAIHFASGRFAPGACSVPSSQVPLLCGQTRTTVRARPFAALIGRLWVSGV